MSTVTINGYFEGVSYAALLDDEEKATPLTGVMVIAPDALVSAVEAATGQRMTLAPTGTTYEVRIDSIEGVMAYLLQHTEVTSMTGDLPDDLQSSDDDVLDAVE